MPKTALFVIDIQVDLADNTSSQIPHASRVRDAAAAILAKARNQINSARTNGENLPAIIVFVQHEERPDQGSLVKGSPLWELVFKPRKDDDAERVVSKTVGRLSIPSNGRLWYTHEDTGDTFESNPELPNQLRSEGVEKIVVFGIQSECCVLSTCKGALAAGFKVALLKGAHSTYDTKSRKAIEIERDVEAELEVKGVEVINWNEY
jgi:nicotinamidase-related amidase